MNTIPTSVTEKQFAEHVRPYISTAKRGYECKIPLYKVLTLGSTIRRPALLFRKNRSV